jgi:Ca-activated chloride channel family protein
MNKPSTHTLKKFTLLILAWEVAFWLLFGGLFLVLNTPKGIGNSYLSFENPEQLWWLWLLGPIIGLFLYTSYQSQHTLAVMGKKTRLTIVKTASGNKQLVRFFLFRNAVVFLIIALAQPAFGTKKTAATIKSMELVVCLDISNSMNAHDIDHSASRLDIAKRAITELINGLSGEKIGITIFANEAFTQLPLTLDYQAAKMFVQEIETNMISNQGTNIQKALENTYAFFSKNKKLSKAVLLITDGESQEGNPSAILERYNEDGIRLAVLGIGTQSGGLVPVDPERPELGYKRTAQGVAVQSKLNPAMIQQIATEANGIALISENAYPNLKGLLNDIASMERASTTGMDFEVKQQRYQIPLLIALACWLSYLLLPIVSLKKHVS